jgi:hypothetical protein
MRHIQALYPPLLRFPKYLKNRVLQKTSPMCLNNGLGHDVWPRRAG